MMKEKALDFLTKYKYTILLLIYFCIIAVLAGEKRICQTTIVAGISSLSLFFIVNILAKTRYSLPFTIIFILIISLDAFFAFNYQTYITLFLLSSMLETDIVEAKETLGLFVISVVVILMVTSFLVFKSQQELRNRALSRRKSALILSIYIIIIIPFVGFVKLKSDDKTDGLFKLNVVLTIEKSLKNITPVFYGDFLTFGAYQHEMWKLKDYVHTNRTLPEGISFEQTKKQPQKIYLIVGETARRDHYSLYGYPVKTTPFLDSLYHTKTVDFNFYQGVAPAPLTREAVKLVLSFASPTNVQTFFDYKNVVEIAKDAGYETNWISNQDKVGIGDGYVGSIGANADKRSFRDMMVEGQLEDLNLIKILKKWHKPNEKQFFVIHLVGSHHDYNTRYDEIDKNSIPGDDIVADYDRSIHHTDRVFREIYGVMKDDLSSSVIYYISDHGEVIGKGHAFGWQQDYRVPVFAISNNTDVVNTDSIIGKYVDQESQLINTSSSIYILSEILGYKIPQSAVDKSIVDGRYVLDKDFKPEMFVNIKAAEE
ncbi:sulfatase-like hydrolase/transferase [Dysgonomonas sp. 520]|uniref:sulfatase-like hydrolase/transferase n=1 Tax=Dysgonomonas sp. 520 TaxID=2302931 RepID=UPI0013D5E83C|nr:sulfatase-like hydrolase/transferase [Dysgonomonas sp. 520]NDW08815.1 DUF1705 domain-containing protein [Dysgonomonas sp. 520]